MGGSAESKVLISRHSFFKSPRVLYLITFSIQLNRLVDVFIFIPSVLGEISAQVYVTCLFIVSYNDCDN